MANPLLSQLKTGLVSVTFRKLSPLEIVQLCSKNGVEGIEWGGDIHVPHGNLQRAKEVRFMCEEAGLKIPSYGSYYRTQASDQQKLDFKVILDTTLELGTTNIRVWLGKKGSAEANQDYIQRTIEELNQLGQMCKDHHVNISFEYHRNTLTDTPESTMTILNQVSVDNIFTYWQMNPEVSFENNLKALQLCSEKLTHLHTFFWTKSERCLLQDGKTEWQAYLEAISHLPEERYALIEFVKDESIEHFIKDVQTLKSQFR